MLALIFVALFGGVLVAIARFNANDVRRNEATVAGWELVQLAKAARLYVRDGYANNPAIRVTLAAGPKNILISDLQSQGYLPSSFGRTDAGGHPINALNQRIYIIETNWSASGMGGPLNTAATVPSAFVYFAPGGKSAPDLTVDVVTAARQENVALTAPLFNAANANISADCRGGGPAVGLWDTGCMTATEFAALVAPLGISTTFAPGALLMPAWKSMQPDLRAVLRFPEPENPGFATMLTDLGMGTPKGDCSLATNQVQLTTTDASGAITQTSTNVCDALSDTSTTDMRFNIDQVGNIMAQRLVAMPQTHDYGTETAAIGGPDDDTLDVSGNVYLGSDLRVYNTKAMPTTNVPPSRFDVPSGTLLVERNAYAYSTNTARKGHATIGTISTANALVSDNLKSQTFKSTATGTTTGAPQMNVTRTTTLTGQLRVKGAGNAELITDTMNGVNDDVHVTDTSGSQAQVTGTLNLNGSTAKVVGASATPGSYQMVAGEVTDAGTIRVNSAQSGGSNSDLQFLAANGSVTANTTSAADLSSPLPIINTTGRCLEGVNVANACADRQYVPPNITP